jgi:hypothetical protein
MCKSSRQWLRPTGLCHNSRNSVLSPTKPHPYTIYKILNRKKLTLQRNILVDFNLPIILIQYIIEWFGCFYERQCGFKQFND